MKLFRYLRAYSYGDCYEEYLIMADNKTEALKKLYHSKKSNGESTEFVQEKYITEIRFTNGIANIGDYI